MKKVILSFTVSLFSVALFAQEPPKVVVPNKENSAHAVLNRSDKWVYKYIINDEKLKTLFVSGEIPVDFPEYDNNISYQENKKIAVRWAQKPENYALLNEEGKKVLEKAINQK